MSVLKNKFIRKSVSLLLSAVMVCCCLSASFAVSADNSTTVSFGACFDKSGRQIRAVKKLVIDGPKLFDVGDYVSMIFADNMTAFCIEPLQNVQSGSHLEQNNSPAWDALSDHQKTALKLTLMYGYQGNLDKLTKLNVSSSEVYVATQLIIWEIVSGMRDTPLTFKCTDNSFINTFYNSKDKTNKGVKAVYEAIDKSLKDYYTIPSFSCTEQGALIYKMKYNNGSYSIELTDTNNVIADYKITHNSNISYTLNNNTLTLSSDEPVNAVQLKLTKKLPTAVGITPFVLWGDKEKQDIVTGLDCNLKKPIAYFTLTAQEVTPPTEPITEPTEPVTTPTEPITEPTEPVTTPTEPITEPTGPVTVPTEPITEPTQPVTTPTEPITEPTEPVTAPTEPITEPTQPVTAPTEPITEPTQPVTAPTEPITEPTQPVTTPTEPITEPTEPITEPTQPVTAPTEPTEPITTPTEPTTPTTPTVPYSKTKNVISTVYNLNNTANNTYNYTGGADNTTGKVATGDSATTIITLSTLMAASAAAVYFLRKRKKQ